MLASRRGGKCCQQVHSGSSDRSRGGRTLRPTIDRLDVSVVIIHFDTPQLLRRCLRALHAAQRELRVETFVVDNASAAFDAAAVTGVYPGAVVMCNQRNEGFAAAANRGIRAASGRYVLLLNPDAMVEPETLTRMVGYMDGHPDVGCSTARLVLENGRLDAACRRSFPTPARSFYRLTWLSRLFPRSRRFGQYNLTYLDEREEAEIDSPCGAFMLVRREVVDEVGLLDERYFMYGEDLDWAYRIKRAGWRITYTPITTVTHIKRASSRSSRARTIRAFYESMRIFYRQYYEHQQPRWLSWLIYRAIDVREALELAAIRRASKGAQH